MVRHIHKAFRHLLTTSLRSPAEIAYEELCETEVPDDEFDGMPSPGQFTRWDRQPRFPYAPFSRGAASGSREPDRQPDPPHYDDAVSQLRRLSMR